MSTSHGEGRRRLTGSKMEPDSCDKAAIRVNAFIHLYSYIQRWTVLFIIIIIIIININIVTLSFGQVNFKDFLFKYEFLCLMQVTFDAVVLLRLSARLH